LAPRLLLSIFVRSFGEVGISEDSSRRQRLYPCCWRTPQVVLSYCRGQNTHQWCLVIFPPTFCLSL